MPSTLKHGIAYPSGSVAPNVPIVMQTLAESVDAALATIDNVPSLEVVSFSGTTWGASLTSAQLAGKNFKFMSESAVVTTDANGYVGITMPYTFPNGYLISGVINGDDWARPNVTYMISTNIFTNTANKFYVRALQNGGTPVNASVVRINYTVTGW